jgi:hypothetical protein
MQVKRQRRQISKVGIGLFGGTSRRLRFVAVGVTAVVLAGAGVTYASTDVFGHNRVGTTYANGIQVSDDQIIKPLGDRLLTQFGKFMGSTVSPDGRFLAATSTDRSVVLQIFDLSSYRLIWTVGTASGVNLRFTNLTCGQEGPTYSPDGKFLWLPEQNGLARFPVNPDGSVGAPTTVPIPVVNGRSALVGQIRYSPDGSTLYAAINGQNAVMAFDADTGALKQTWQVGIAPRELAFVGAKLYVSDEGGRQAQAGESTMDSYGTQTPANGYLGTSTTGTVSVIDTREHVRGGRIHRRRSAPDCDVRQGQGVVRRQRLRRHRLGDRHDQGPGRADDRGQAVAVVERRVRADQHRDDERRPPAGHARPRERRRGLPIPRRPAAAGELHRAGADGLLPGDRGDRRRPDRRHQHARHRRAGPRALVQQGSGNRGRGWSRHAQHHRLADP